MRRIINYIIPFLLMAWSFAQDPNWDSFDATAYEFSATLSAAEVYIDGNLKTTGQLLFLLLQN